MIIDPPLTCLSALAAYDAEIDQLIDCGKYFYQRGWSVGTSSNYSTVVGREPLRLLVTASGKDKGNLGHADFVLVDELGHPTRPDQQKSSAETLLHIQAVRKSGVRSVLHTHSVWSTVLSERFAAEGAIRFHGFEMQKGLAGISTHDCTVTLPIFDNTQDIAELAVRVDRFAKEFKEPFFGYLIRRHGLYTWGKDISEARRHVEIIEFLLEALGRQLSLT